MKDVSVVIPTRGRETRLAFALEALAEQTLGAERFEVVVVRDGGAAGPFATAPDGLDVRFVALGGPGSRPAKRNAGWRAASAPVIAFTDDDCRPCPGWLEGLVEAAAGGAAAGAAGVFVQGPTVPDPDERHLLFGLARSVAIDAPTPWYETCNIAYPRALLERLGGFDERFVATGEDTDLGLRALAAGCEPRWAAEAAVRHAVFGVPLHRAIESGWSGWQTTPLIFRVHPEHRRFLTAGVFRNRTHAALAALLAAAGLARRRPLVAAALATPFVVDSIDPANSSPRGLLRQLAHLPARLARELAIAAGLARGAVRHRAPIF